MIRTITCFEITCDRDCYDKGWEEGTPHFPTEQEAVGYARHSGFVIVGTAVLCRDCARDADCETTGHQWTAWRESGPYGVPCNSRSCEHCGAHEYDQPIEELAVLVEAAKIVNGDSQQGPSEEESR